MKSLLSGFLVGATLGTVGGLLAAAINQKLK